MNGGFLLECLMGCPIAKLVIVWNEMGCFKMALIEAKRNLVVGDLK